MATPPAYVTRPLWAARPPRFVRAAREASRDRPGRRLAPKLHHYSLRLLDNPGCGRGVSGGHDLPPHESLMREVRVGR